jgi:hypothetical protein
LEGEEVMPYIQQEEREKLLSEPNYYPDKPGELNFLITKLCLEYLDGKESYTDYNEVIGALECCKLEFYARKVRPYEDVKILENGDVF